MPPCELIRKGPSYAPPSVGALSPLTPPQYCRRLYSQSQTPSGTCFSVVGCSVYRNGHGVDSRVSILSGHLHVEPIQPGLLILGVAGLLMSGMRPATPALRGRVGVAGRNVPRIVEFPGASQRFPSGDQVQPGHQLPGRVRCAVAGVLKAKPRPARASPWWDGHRNALEK